MLARFNVQLAAETEDLALDPVTVRAGIDALLRDPTKGLYHVAEAAGEVVGQLMITYEWSDWRNGMIWWIQSVYVRPDLRGRGVFAQLFRHLLGLARAQPDVCGIRLYMHSENDTARKTYERLGMRQTRYEVFEVETGAGPIESGRGEAATD